MNYGAQNATGTVYFFLFILFTTTTLFDLIENAIQNNSIVAVLEHDLIVLIIG
jgi:hypothetical protein